MSGFDMDGYVPVAERIDAFVAKHPEGSLQSEIVELTESRVTVKAYAYRSPDDPRPGIGHSSLDIPGKTSFTRGSEIENAETSAWGRAIASLGFEVKRGIASREEARNKQPEPRSRGERSGARHAQAVSVPSAPARSPEEQALLDELLALPHMTTARLSLLADAAHVEKGARANADQLREMLRIAQEPLPEHPGQGDATRGASHPAPESTPDERAASSGQGAAVGSGTAAPDSDAGDGGAPSAAPATSAAAPSPPGGAPSTAPTIDDVLAVTGGELVPPRPGTDEYRALPAQERARARAYWQEHAEPARPNAEQLRAAIGGES